MPLVIFWLLHSFNLHAWSSPWVAVNRFSAGVILALAYMASGNIWFPTAMHFAWNFSQGVLFGVPISGVATTGFYQVKPTAGSPDWLTGGEFGLEATAPMVAAQGVLAVAFLLWIRHNAKDNKGKPSHPNAGAKSPESFGQP